MNPRERGFLLLTSQLGDPERRPLTAVRFRRLAQRMQGEKKPADDRELTVEDLKRLGFGGGEAARILALLSEEDRLDHYLARAERSGCHCLTPFSGFYPQELENALGTDAPAVLWYRGDAQLLRNPKIALVGSRDIGPENAEFARQAGIAAARQGFTLVSGNARGADRIAQDACLEAGGSVISIVADALTAHTPSERHLFLCEDSFDLPFSNIRALSRNRCIHALGQLVLVAQAALQKGGTWDGTSRNLRLGWSPVYCFADGSDAATVLEQMGAQQISLDQLADLSALPKYSLNLFDQ